MSKISREDFIVKYTTDTSIDRRVAVHCPTRRLAKQLLRQAKRLGFEWFNPTERTHWGKYREETVYVLIKFGTILEYSDDPVNRKIQFSPIWDVDDTFVIVPYEGEIV